MGNLEGIYAKENKSDILSEGLVMPRKEKVSKFIILFFSLICFSKM